MSPKLPVKGTVTVDVHTRPGDTAARPTSQRDVFRSVDVNPATAISIPAPYRPGPRVDEPGLNAIRLAPAGWLAHLA